MTIALVSASCAREATGVRVKRITERRAKFSQPLIEPPIGRAKFSPRECFPRPARERSKYLLQPQYLCTRC
jgi:hypothetical protein